MYNIRAHETFSRLRDKNNLEYIFAPRLRLSAKTALDCLRPSRVKKSRFRSYIINTYYPTEAPKSLISAQVPCSYNIYIYRMKKLVAAS